MGHNCAKCLRWYSDAWHDDMGYEDGKDGLCPSCWANNEENKEVK